MYATDIKLRPRLINVSKLASSASLRLDLKSNGQNQEALHRPCKLPTLPSGAPQPARRQVRRSRGTAVCAAARTGCLSIRQGLPPVSHSQLCSSSASLLDFCHRGSACPMCSHLSSTKCAEIFMIADLKSCPLNLHHPHPSQTTPYKHGNAAARAQTGDDSKDSDEEAGESSKKMRWRDHVNELGLPNDGYDYGRHLKTMGGGRFIAASGEVGSALPGDGIFELPEDPEHWRKARTGQGSRDEEGQKLLKPVVDAITLSADCMDEDMEEALFGSDGDEGAEEEGGVGGMFEELNDDFILQAGRELDSEGEGAGGGFDFEAHMAMLIAKSEKSLGWAPARGWEDGELEKLQQLIPHKDLEGYDTDEVDDDEEEAGARRKSAAAMRRHRPWGARAENGSGAGVVSRKDHASMKDDFEDLLAEYNEDDIGELEDPEEAGANTRGFMDVEGGGDGMGGPGCAYIEHILDDFLRAKIAEIDEEEARTEVREHAEGRGDTPRRKSVGLFASSGGLAEEEGEEPAEEWEEAGDEEGVTAGGMGEADDMEQFIVKHNYLGDRDGPTPWDCETILSTCSNLDNHPSLIIEEGRQRKGKKGKNNMYRGKMPGLPEEERGPEKAVAMVALSKKSGLPLGVLPMAEKKKVGVEIMNAGSKRDKAETEEEKRLRKAAVKQARREGRAKKKEMAQAFKVVEKVANIHSRSGETAVARSVFQYS